MRDISLLMAGAVAVAMVFGVAASAVSEPTVSDAVDFVARAEAALSKQDEYVRRVAWVQATDITDDTNWLLVRASSESTDSAVRYAKEAARFDHVRVDAVTARKLYLLKQGLTLPAPSRAGASEELATLRGRLPADYSTAKFTYKGRLLTLDDMEDLLQPHATLRRLGHCGRDGGRSHRRR